jgi:hypothetical protein
MAFVNVVGGSEIYNFHIQCFGHLYSKFLSKLCSNRGSAKPKFAGPTLRRDVASRRHARTSASVPRIARGPADRGRRVLRHPRPDVPRI